MSERRRWNDDKLHAVSVYIVLAGLAFLLIALVVTITRSNV